MSKHVNETFIQTICTVIKKNTGMRVSGTHIQHIQKYIEKRMADLSLNESDFFNYLSSHSQEFESLVNEASINETYFFREANQFSFLKEVIFPKYQNEKVAVKIWSCASSTGEEAISLLSLANHCNIKASIWASDIDSRALTHPLFNDYGKNSWRADGSIFHPVLKNVLEKKENGNYALKTQAVAQLNFFSCNLIQTNPREDFKNTLDIIFMRNVFIYFDHETRYAILKKITPLLKENGYLFLSSSEIPTIDVKKLPLSLKKCKWNDVYYFHKKSAPVVTEKNKPKKKQSKTTIIPIQKNQKPEEVFKNISVSLGNKNFEEALKKAENFSSSLHQKHIKAFFLGYTHKACGNSEKAKEWLEKSELYNPSFWPAYFTHALLYVEQGESKKSKKLFEKCICLLKNCSKDKKKMYAYCIESFDVDYIYTTCCKYLENGENNVL